MYSRWEKQAIFVSLCVIFLEKANPQCTGGQLTAENWQEAQKKYQQFKHDNSASLVQFHFDFGSDDVIKLRKELGQADTFDPTLWAWVAPRGRYLLELPLDYDLASLGLLSLSVYHVNVNLSQVGSLKGDCLDQALSKLLLENITYETGKTFSALDDDGAICRSSYVHPSFMSSAPMCVGMKCCTKSTKESHHRNKYQCNTVFYDDRHKIKEVHMSFGIIFSVIFYFVYFGWKRFRILFYARKKRTWDWLRNYFGYKSKHYTTYILQGKPGQRDHWIALSEDDLVPKGGALTLADLWVALGGSRKSSRVVPVLRVLLWALVASVVINYVIPHFYQYKETAMKLMRDGQELAFNFRTIPIAWLQNHEFSWPKGFAAALLVAVYVNIFIDLVCAFALCLCPSPEKRPTKPSGKNGKSGGKTVCMVCIAVVIALLHIFVGVLYLVAVVYPLTQVFVFILTAALVNADIVIPYFVAVFFVFYYLRDAYMKLQKPFTQMRRLLYDEYLHFEEASVAFEYQTFGLEQGDTTSLVQMRQVEPPRNKITRKTASHLLVLYHKDNCARILKTQYLDLCDQLIDKRKHLLTIVVHLILVLSFIGLVLFTLLTFRPPGEYFTRSLESIIAGTVALFAISIPIMYEKFGNADESSMQTTWTRYEIVRYLESLVLDYDTASKRSSAGPSIYGSRLNYLLQRPGGSRMKMRSVSNPGTLFCTLL